MAAGTSGMPSGGAAGVGGGEQGDSAAGETGATAATLDAGSRGEGGSPPFMYPPGCPVPSPEPAAAQVLVIQSVSFETSQIVIKNVSSVDQTIIAGGTGWQWCDFPNYGSVIQAEGAANDVVLSPGETYQFTAITRMGPLQLFADAGAMAIYITTGAFTTPSLIRAFVAWGDYPPDNRETTGAEAMVWTAGERIALGATVVGFINRGPSDRAGGYRGVSDPACLVAPPNEPD